MDTRYRMILVDDEDEVRGRIHSKISEGSGFTIVGTAGNGYDALELIEQQSPHIVLTDIKMPYIDGIELTRIIKRDHPTVKVAFITGYDEFAYAKEAVDLHISSFLTKPVSQEEITSFLRKLKKELDEEFEREYSFERLRLQYEQSIPMIVENFFITSLIAASPLTEESIEHMKEYHVSLDESRYLLVYIKLDSPADAARAAEQKISTRSSLSHVLERYGYDHYGLLYLDGLVYVIKEQGEDFKRRIDLALFEGMKIIERFLGITANMGVSCMHRSFYELNDAFTESETALGYTSFLEQGRIAYRDQLESEPTRILSLPEQSIGQLSHAAKYGSEKEISAVLADMLDDATKGTQVVKNFRLYSIDLVHVLLKYAQSIGVNIQDLLPGDILEILGSFRTPGQLFSWTEDMLLRLKSKSNEVKKDNSQKFLDAAVRYIQTNYSDPGISMETVCDELGISISYLSLLFKKHRETTFVKYLTKVRMERAKELLHYSPDRISEIARSCGYRDVYYFSHSFKRFYGVSPRNYREKSST